MKSIIHALGHNRARQRDKLAHLLEEFAALQDEVILCLCEWFESRSHPLKCYRSKLTGVIIFSVVQATNTELDQVIFSFVHLCALGVPRHGLI